MYNHFARDFAYYCKYERSVQCIELLEKTEYKYIDCKLEYDETPILTTLWCGLPDVAQLLYNHKCDLSAVDKYGFNVMMSASRCNNKFIKILLENHKNIDINAKNWKNKSALSIALYYDNVNGAILLANYGADIDSYLSIENTNTFIRFRKIMYDSYKKLVIAEIDNAQSIIYRSFQTTYAIELVNIICDFII
jgi:ankyrin repeat protein